MREKKDIGLYNMRIAITEENAITLEISGTESALLMKKVYGESYDKMEARLIKKILMAVGEFTNDEKITKWEV